MILSDATLQQIAGDARVDPVQFTRFVQVFGMSIVRAVNACRDVENGKREVHRARKQAASKSVRSRRQVAAERYANEAWRYDVR